MDASSGEVFGINLGNPGMQWVDAKNAIKHPSLTSSSTLWGPVLGHSDVSYLSFAVL